MVEARGDDVFRDDPFASPALPGKRVAFELSERATHRTAMRFEQAAIFAQQGLNADGFGSVEGRVPSRASAVIPTGLLYEHLPVRRMQSMQHRAECLGRDLAGQSERRRAVAEPLADNASFLGVVIVLRLFLLVVGLRLFGAQRSFRHYEHGYANGL